MHTQRIATVGELPLSFTMVDTPFLVMCLASTNKLHVYFFTIYFYLSSGLPLLSVPYMSLMYTVFTSTCSLYSQCDQPISCLLTHSNTVQFTLCKQTLLPHLTYMDCLHPHFLLYVSNLHQIINILIMYFWLLGSFSCLYLYFML